jgi:uncharacterized membrane protein
MKRLIEFIKTTAIGGLIVIVPITFLILVFTQVLNIVAGLTNTIAGFLPFDPPVNAAAILAVAIFGVVLICFLTGLILQTGPGNALRNWLSRNIAERLPMYGMLRNLTQRFVGMEGTQFALAEINLYGSEARLLGFIVETLPDDRYAVFVPQAPIATIGHIYVLPKSNVHQLNASMADAVNAITQWGVGTDKLYPPKKPDLPKN